jgi:hypothetical protein
MGCPNPTDSLGLEFWCFGRFPSAFGRHVITFVSGVGSTTLPRPFGIFDMGKGKAGVVGVQAHIIMARNLGTWLMHLMVFYNSRCANYVGHLIMNLTNSPIYLL